LKRLVAKPYGAADTLAGPANRSYAETVQRYHQACCAYNSSCAGKTFDPDQLAAAKQTLSCYEFRRGKARPGWDAWGRARPKLSGKQKRSRPARDLAAKSRIVLV
jgi:hypothetical protein